MDITTQKKQLRTAIRRQRRELSETERKLSANTVADLLCDMRELNSARVVLSYMPMPDELDIQKANTMLIGRGVKVAYPLCVGEGGLRLLIPSGQNGFKAGAYGILEPIIEASVEIGVDELDAIILPAIGFDRKCRRLGQGGGYYDRLLEKAECFTVAVGFDCQLVDNIPIEATDRAVDAVITPSGVIKQC